MSFGSGSTQNLPSQPANTFGIPKNRGATNQQAVPVPYFCGKQRISVTWLSKAFAQSTSTVYTRSGKENDTISGYNYRADIAGLIGHGKVDAIYAVYLNRQLVAGTKEPYGTALTTRGSEDFVDVALNIGGDYGTMRLYWGTETQTVDPTLTASGQDHPAYRGFCYAVFKQLFLGFNQTNVQNIEVVVARWPAPTWLSAASNFNGDVNPIAFIADLAQSPRAGFALPDEFFDTTILNATSAQLLLEVFGFSPLLTERKELKQWYLQANEYFDGYCIASVGKFAIGALRPPADVPTVIIDKTMIVDRPSFQPEDWSVTQSETSVQYTDRAIALQPNVKVWRDTAARLINDNADPLQLDRSWLTDGVLAEIVAQAAGQSAALPATPGKAMIRRTGTLFDDLAPSALFLFDYPGRGIDGVLFRVTERTLQDPAKPEFEISFTLDRSYLYPVPGLGGRHIADEGGGGDGKTSPAALENVRVVELPIALCPEGKLSLAVLAARPDTTIVAINILLARNVNNEFLDSYATLAAQGNFAIHGKLTADYNAINVIDDTIGLTVQLDGPDTDLGEQTLFDALSNDFLAFIGNEVFAISGANLTGTNAYQIFVCRGRYATPIEAHSFGDDVYIIRARDLNLLQHDYFQVNNTARFKLQTVQPPTAQDLGDITPIDYAIVGRIYQQTPPTNLRVGGLSAGAGYASGAGVTITWTLTDAGRDFYEPHLYTAYTVLEFLSGETVLGSIAMDAGISILELSNADLIGLLGGSEVSFTLRATTKIVNTWFIANSAAITLDVTKL